MVNRWTTNQRKCEVIGGFLKGIVAAWFDDNRVTMNNNWVITSNGDNNFVDLFKARFASETRVNQWYHELTTLRQKNDESVDAYTNIFIKLATRVNLTDERQKKRMYLIGLNSAYTALVYAQNPADFVRTVEVAKRVETEFNVASGSMFKPSKPEVATSTPNSITQTLIENTPVFQLEVEALTKKLKQ